MLLQLIVLQLIFYHLLLYHLQKEKYKGERRDAVNVINFKCKLFTDIAFYLMHSLFLLGISFLEIAAAFLLECNI